MSKNVPDIGGVDKSSNSGMTKTEFNNEVGARKKSSQSFANTKSLGMDKSSMPKFKDNPTRKL